MGDKSIPARPDPRHHVLLCEIDALYRKANGSLPMPSAGRAAKALKLFLDENPQWPAGTLILCARNRFLSRGLNLAAPPHSWISMLPSFARGPLDEWGKPMRRQEKKETQWEQALREL